MNIASILCPTDFSEPSRHAMEYAAAIAAWYHARVIRLHVQVPALETVPPLAHDAVPTAWLGTQVVSGPSPAQAIVDFAESDEVDLVVMGTHGHNGFQHLILGSVTETVLRKVHVPVLAVPPRAHSTTSGLPFKRLLCAIDFSASSIAALELASGLALDGGSRLHIVHVVDEPGEHELFVARPYDVHHHAEIYEHHVKAHLEGVLSASAREKLNPHVHIVRGTAEDRILQTAVDLEADVIVMGVGRGYDPAFGSTVNFVVRNAKCPVLTVRR
jgi:nucleotide-binding universal stress UspA family protein